ncbi:Uncharacterised protein [Mycobacterium tuberculosis]|nr:Uncharacterised protein [Mycobacterium tuberculosis]
MRSQAQAIEADAQVRAREILERARVKSQKIVDAVTGHTSTVVRDAEDRARQLRWQQQQLTSFMAEVRELIRPDGIFGDDSLPTEIAVTEATIDEDDEENDDDVVDASAESFRGDEVLDDEFEDDRPLEKITIDVIETDDSSKR